MNMNNINFLHETILNKIIKEDTIGNRLLEKKVIEKYISSPLFLNKLSFMIKKKDFSCQAVYLLCHDLLVQLDPKHLSENWLYQVYQYVLSLSFPEAIEVSNVHVFKINKRNVFLYLKLLRIISEFQKTSNDNTFQSRYPFVWLTVEERKKLEYSAEYKRFLKAIDEEYIYEMMKLSQEVLKYNTLDHICGVNQIALFIGRQCKEFGLPVDLGRVSGAAIGHDLGKYGCKGIELKRTPYLHYYYTDLWFKKHNIPYIGHIAVNHSVWDLELENLPIESLILIYSDFRVKNIKSDSKNEMKIFDLKTSFQVILDKLDNVDEQKKKRYCRVYAKLRDFEDYLIHLGVKVNIEEKENISFRKRKKTYYSLLHSREVIQNIKFLGIEHNINLMYELRNESSLNSLLELARNEKSSNNLREYLQIFQEYTTYLTQKQKIATIGFLYEILFHPQPEIRRRSARLIGRLIASFDEDYRKEIPQNVKLKSADINSVDLLKKYIKCFLQPDYKKILLYQSRIITSTECMVSSLFLYARAENISQYKKTVLKYYKKNIYKNKDIHLSLIKIIPYLYISGDTKLSSTLFGYLLQKLKETNHNLRLAALEVVYEIIVVTSESSLFIKNLKKIFSKNISQSSIPAESYLNMKIVKALHLDKKIMERYKYFHEQDMKNLQYLFLSNLKSSTSPMVKKIQIELLSEHTLRSKKDEIYTALHFCNILKVSGVEEIRNLAGHTLIGLMDTLSFEQRNDIAIELLRALEMEDYQFTKYIPFYLGQMILFMPPGELDELINDLIGKIKQSDPKLSSLLLRTIGIAIANYPQYRERFSEEKSLYKLRLSKMIGILLNGFVHYNIQVKQAAFRVIGREIFGSEHLNLEEKNTIFQLIAKKILTLLTSAKKEELMFLINCNGLNYMCKFISDYNFFIGKINLKTPEKVAFFPGAFDPFSLSHREIVRKIDALGFEIYLEIDEFSWSKRTQPHMFRKNIINISIADELNLYLFPDDLPVNLVNPDNLEVLKKSFPFSKIYIVVGTDVLLNASAYRNKKTRYSIHTFPHIIFDRRSFKSSLKKEELYQEVLEKIEGETIELNLIPRYEDISSTRIRDNIDENRDISKFIDPLAQKYIYENSLYQREPQYKSITQTISIDVQIIEKIQMQLIEELKQKIFSDYNTKEIYDKFIEFNKKLNPRILLFRDLDHGGDILGFSMFHWVRSSFLYQEFKNNQISEYVRENTSGRTIVIDGVFTIKEAKNKSKIKNIEQLILSETVSFCIGKDYTFAIFKDMINSYPLISLNETLKLMGFYRLPFTDEKNPVFVVDMSKPCIINLDAETIIKEPFNKNRIIQKAIIASRKKLLKSVTTFYPGNIVLPFNISFTNQTVVKKVCDINHVSIIPSIPRVLGKSICVPFGKVLHKLAVPNTVTKSLHTEKTFNPDMKKFEIVSFPNYLSLENQAKVIHSFNMPVILVDDYLHKGYRIKALEPLFKKYNIKVKKIVVGTISGSGREIANLLNRDVESAYFIPNLRLWFNECELFPFIGGDALKRKKSTQGNLVRSINPILPYTFPNFIKKASENRIFEFSKVCIENALNILNALENEYQITQQRKLTLGHLGEVIIYPRYPDQGEDMDYNLNLSPTHYLRNDLELLNRTGGVV